MKNNFYSQNFRIFKSRKSVLSIFVLMLVGLFILNNVLKKGDIVKNKIEEHQADAPKILTAISTKATKPVKKESTNTIKDKEQKKRQIAENIADSPVAFTKNMGQWKEDILFRSNIPGMNIFYLKNGLSYGFAKGTGKDHEQLVWNQYFEGMNSNAEIVGAGVKGDMSVNYIIGMGGGNNKTLADVPDFAELNYKNVYNNIDVKYYGNSSAANKLETDFILKTGANINDIKIHFEGIKGLSVDKKGILSVKDAWGALREYIPSSYQIVNGTKKEVNVKYKLLDQQSYGFEVCGNYDRLEELVIDPVILDWATFAGPVSLKPGQPGFTGAEYLAELYDLVCDSLGNTYSVGMSQDKYPTTPGVYQVNNAGQEDVLVFKMNPKGTALVWATYIGTYNSGGIAKTKGGDRGWGIDIDAGGSVYVTGSTDKGSFPTTAGAFKTTYTDTNTVAFALKLNPSGSTLVYSTFLGQKNSRGQSIKVLPTGEAIVGGYTSTGFPVTSGAFQTILAGGIDGFITKLNPTGTALVYSTYVGGAKNDTVFRIALDISGNVYACGTTASTDFPTLGAYQSALNGTLNDAFLFKMNPSGSALLYSTYFGGSSNDEGYGVAVNTAGQAYICGTSNSVNMPVLAAYQPIKKASSDAFVTKFNASGSALIYSTYLGGTLDDWGYDVEVDCHDEAFVNGSSRIPSQGQTTTAGFPVTACGFSEIIGSAGTSPSPCNDFITKFSSSGSLLYSSIKYSASAHQLRTAMDIIEVNCCVTGIVSGGNAEHEVTGIDFITTPGVFQAVDPRWTKYSVPFLFRITPKPNMTLNVATTACPAAPQLSVLFGDTCWGKPSLNWDFGDATTGSGNIFTHTYTQTGTYTVTVITQCPADTLKKTVTITSVASCALTLNTTGGAVCAGGCITVSSVPTGGTSPYTYSWNNGATDSSVSVCPLTTTIYTLTVTDNAGVTSTGTATATIYPAIVLTTTKTDLACNGVSNGTAIVSASAGSSPYSYIWNSVPAQTSATASNLAAGIYTVTVSDTKGCTKTISDTIKQPPVITVNTTPVSTATCGSSTGSVSVTAVGGTGTYTYNWSNNATGQTISGLSAGTYTVTITDANGCIKTSTTVVNSPPVPNIGTTVTPEQCGLANGAISVAVTGSAPPYTYSWSNGATTVTVNGFQSGIYSVTVTDSKSCSSSTVATVNCVTGIKENANTLSMSIYPNPNNGSFNLTIEGDKNESVNIVIADVRGRVVHSGIINIISGKNSSDIDLSAYPAGIYTLRVISSGSVVNRKIVVQ